jgi:ubiquinone biosynthesis protein
VQIPGSIFLLIKAIATIEKVGLNLDPEISIAGFIRPYARDLVKKQYSLPKIAKDILKSVKKYIALGKSLPDEISDILFNIKSGKLTHDIRLDSQELFTKTIRQAGKTIALAILLSFLIAGTSYLRAKGNDSFMINAVFFISVFYAFIIVFRLFARLRV